MGTIDTILRYSFRQGIATPAPGKWNRFSARHALAESLLFLHLRFAKRQSRRDLGRLSDHHLRDIGLTRDDVEREIGRSLWD